MAQQLIAIGFGLAWISYSLGLWGYSLIKGYNLGPKQIVSPTAFYAGKWPPQQAGNTVIIPNGSQADIQTTALTLTNDPGNPLGGGAPSNPAGGVANTKTIKQAASAYGWQSGGQYNALTHVIAAESGGNPTATNPTSGAFGIAQALGHGNPDGSTAGTFGNEYGGFGLTNAEASQANSGNALQQLRWMMNYIKATYGTPAAAWDHEQQQHWY